MKFSVKTIALVSTIGITAFAGLAQANQKPSDEALVSVCESIQNDDTLELNNLMKQHRLNIRAIEKGLKCNGQTPMEFAVSNDAFDVANKIANRLPSDKRLIAKL